MQAEQGYCMVAYVARLDLWCLSSEEDESMLSEAAWVNLGLDKPKGEKKSCCQKQIPA